MNDALYSKKDCYDKRTREQLRATKGGKATNNIGNRVRLFSCYVIAMYSEY